VIGYKSISCFQILQYLAYDLQIRLLMLMACLINPVKFGKLRKERLPVYQQTCSLMA